MKLILKANTQASLICKADNKDYKHINLNKSYKITLPDSVKKIEIIHNDSERKNVVGLMIMSLVCFFLESQKTFEKREFISFYEFAQRNLISNFYFENDSSDKKEISVFLKEKDFGKFKCLLWYSHDVRIHNSFSKKILKRSLKELIIFWFTVLLIPFAVLAGVTIGAYVKSNDIFDLGIILIAFLLCVFIVNVVCFVIQHKRILKNLSDIES